MSLRKIRKQIHYHSTQIWGVTVVLFIIFGLIILGQYSSWNHVNTEYNNEEHISILASLQTRSAERDLKAKKKYSKKNHIEPHNFDPNTISKDELVDMGIKESIARSWTNYTSKGGKFKKAEDLKKLYSMNDYLYDKLHSFVEIKNQKKENKHKSNQYKKNKTWVKNKYKNNNYTYNQKDSTSYQNNAIDAISDIERKEYSAEFKASRKEKSNGLADNYIIVLNTTDSTELLMLNGIGHVLSSRIIKYRDKLGGFHNKNQLLEVYGVKAALISKIMNKISFEGTLKKIDLNYITVDSLVQHPYFDYSTANIFINYRNHHGPYKGLDDVKKIIAIKQYWLDEVSPYFSYSVDK